MVTNDFQQPFVLVICQFKISIAISNALFKFSNLFVLFSNNRFLLFKFGEHILAHLPNFLDFSPKASLDFIQVHCHTPSRFQRPLSLEGNP